MYVLKLFVCMQIIAATQANGGLVFSLKVLNNVKTGYSGSIEIIRFLGAKAPLEIARVSQSVSK